MNQGIGSYDIECQGKGVEFCEEGFKLIVAPFTSMV